MKKCPNCHGTTIKKPPVTTKQQNDTKVTTIIGKKPAVGGKKTKI